VRVLRLLKSGAVKSLKDCAPLVGYSVSQLVRWWERYRAEGLTAMLKQHQPAGKASKLSAEAWAGLQEEMRAGHIAAMQEARNYLEGEGGISYKNGKQLGWLFKKHRVKCKTGRRRHQKANAQQQAAFKKTSGA
jgi:transposase